MTGNKDYSEYTGYEKSLLLTTLQFLTYPTETQEDYPSLASHAESATKKLSNGFEVEYLVKSISNVVPEAMDNVPEEQIKKAKEDLNRKYHKDYPYLNAEEINDKVDKFFELHIEFITTILFLENEQTRRER